MSCMIPLARYAIARCKIPHIPPNLDNNPCIAIASSTWKSWFAAGFTSIYIIVDFRAHTDGRIFVTYKYAVIRYWGEIKLLQLDISETSVDEVF